MLILNGDTTMNRHIFLFHGWAIMIVSLLAVTYHSEVYGNNLVAVTTPEAITDLICVLIFLTGTVLMTIGKAMPKEK